MWLVYGLDVTYLSFFISQFYDFSINRKIIYFYREHNGYSDNSSIRGENKMQLELTSQDLSLINTMLNKELGDTRVEIRHSSNFEYKKCLEEREQEINSLLGRITAVLPKKQGLY